MPIDNIQQPPRRIPFLVWWDFVFVQSQLIRRQNFVWLMCALVLYAYIHEGQHPFIALVPHGSYKTVQGTVIRRANPEIHHKDYLVWFTCSYTVNGQMYKGALSGSPYPGAVRVGDTVTIEYLPTFPECAKIQGMKRPQTPGEGYLILLFNFGFFSAFILNFINLNFFLGSFRDIRLLRYGKVAVATLDKSTFRIQVLKDGKTVVNAKYTYTTDTGKQLTHSEWQGFPHLLSVKKLLDNGEPLRVIWWKLRNGQPHPTREEFREQPRHCFAEQATLLYMPDCSNSMSIPGQHPGVQEYYASYHIAEDGRIVPKGLPYQFNFIVAILIFSAIVARLFWLMTIYWR